MSNKRVLLIAVGLIGGLAVLAIGWYLASPLFIDNMVDEAFPFTLPDDEAMAAMSAEEKAQMEADFMTAVPDDETLAHLSDADLAGVENKVMETAASMPDKTADDPMPAEPAAIASGTFQGADDFHQGAGQAALYELPDGQRVLRFEEFTVTNGPDLHVILSTHPAPASRSDVGDDYVDLGRLKGNVGNQNYEIPGDVDLSQYQSIVIYCQPFHVVFAAATLN